MASEPVDRSTAISRELIALTRAVQLAEQERNARLEAKLADLDRQMDEADRIQKLITGGAARREARLRALEDMIEVIAAERSREATPKPLDLPRRNRFDASVVDMHSPDPEPTSGD